MCRRFESCRGHSQKAQVRGLFLDRVWLPAYPPNCITPRKPRGPIGNSERWRISGRSLEQARWRPSDGVRSALSRPTRRERSKTFERKVDAELFVATIETDVARGQYIDPLLGKMFFGEFAHEWLATTGHLKPKTREGYESILRTHLLPAFGDRPIGKVRPVDVGQFFLGLAEHGMSVSRMRQTKNVLKRIFDEAVRNGYLARSV